MSDLDIQQRLEALEIRYTHQESALQALTGTVLSQERVIRLQADRLERLEKQLRAQQTAEGVAGGEERPPHY